MDVRNFDIYVVGGFVRDLLLGLDPKDTDFVVVHATVGDLMEFGQEHDLQFKQVGEDFPVFLDKNGHEWALARTERKVGPGYHGFEVEFDPSVTIEEDLLRRDLTINAMAVKVLEFGENLLLDHEIVDPHGGQEDLENKLLRHTSEFFVEDPVRVLRIARFAARYNFGISNSTHHLIQKMAESGELDSLVSERVWTEFEKAMSEMFIVRFFDALNDSDALTVIFPELSKIWNNTSIVRRMLGRINFNDPDRLAMILCAFVGFMSPKDAQKCCTISIKMPKDLAAFVMKFTALVATQAAVRWNLPEGQQPTAESIINIFNEFDVFRDKNFLNRACRVERTLVVDCDDDKVFLEALEGILAEVRIVGFDDLTDDEKSALKGPQIGEAIRKLRMEVIDRELRNGTQLVLT